MSTTLGLVFATAARNAQMLFALIKGTGFLIVGPVVFYLFPEWPMDREGLPDVLVHRPDLPRRGPGGGLRGCLVGVAVALALPSRRSGPSWG